MVELIIFTHGSLAESFKESLDLIVGESTRVHPLTLYEGDNLAKIDADLRLLVQKIEEKKNTAVILTDIFFGTPFNVTVNLMNEKPLMHIVGFNLPLVIELYLMTKNNEKIEMQELKRVMSDSKNAIKIIEEDLI